MELELDEDHALFQDVARRMLEEEVTRERLTAWADSELGFDPALERRMIDLGWLSASLAQQTPDGRLDPVPAGIVAQELGRSGLATPFLASMLSGVAAACVLTDAGQVLVDRVLSGGRCALVTATDPRELPRMDGDTFGPSGSWLVEWAHVAETLVVATDSTSGLRLLAVPADHSGVHIERVQTFDNERVARVALHGVALRDCAVLSDDDVRVRNALAIARIVRAAGVVGGAERMLDLTVEHVRSRHQFGRALAEFQAVKHKCADMAIGITAAGLAGREALDTARYGLACSTEPVATAAACEAAVFAATEGAQLHGGVGFITEYVLHFFYRRAKAVELRLGGRSRQLAAAARALLDDPAPSWEGPFTRLSDHSRASSEGPASGVDFRFDRRTLELLDEFRAWLDQTEYRHVLNEADVDLQEVGPKGVEFGQVLGRAGWLGIGWPVEFGGRGGSEFSRWLATEELEYRALPHGGMAAATIGPTLIRVGSEEQKRTFLPKILVGDLDFALGYSEPNAGTDLASLTTRAVRDGDEYVVTGQKIYTTAAHLASHVWLAVRTGPTGSRHRGISVLLVALDSPGVTVRELVTQSDGRTNEVFYDDVRVPAANLVGEENDGWGVMMMALDFERAMPYSRNRYLLDQLLAWAHTTTGPAGRPIDDAATKQTLAELAIRVELVRLLALNAAHGADRGRNTTVESSMAKIWLAELRQDLAGVALGLFGEEGQLRFLEPGAIGEGAFERAFRAASMLRFAGGTNEIQRDLIANRGLGLRG